MMLLAVGNRKTKKNPASTIRKICITSHSRKSGGGRDGLVFRIMNSAIQYWQYDLDSFCLNDLLSSACMLAPLIHKIALPALGVTSSHNAKSRKKKEAQDCPKAPFKEKTEPELKLPDPHLLDR